MSTPLTRLAALLALAVLALTLVQTAAAAPRKYSSFSIRPVSGSAGFFVFDGKRGARLVGTFRIVNTGTRKGTALLYTVDATTGATSGAVYLDRTAKRRGLGRWVTVPLRRVTLRPGEAKTVRFDVRVPRRTRAGNHLGAIVAENAELTTGAIKRSKRSGLQIRIRHLSIVAVQVNLPGGQAARMAFRGVKVDVSSGYEVLYLALRNRGNVLLRPSLAVQVRNEAGRVVVRRRLKLDTFVPKTRISYPLYLLRKPLPAGSYRLAGTLSYLNRVTRFRTTFVISPEHVEQLPLASQLLVAAEPQRQRSSVLPWALAGTALVVGLGLGAFAIHLSPFARG